mgnify:CR=1 FL=1
MVLVHPRFLALDSATLIKVSRDFWSSDTSLRHKAREFTQQLADKRTNEYLNQIRASRPEPAELMGHYFRTTDYSKIPGILDREDGRNRHR